MNPLLNERIARFDSPFRRLDQLLAGIAPNPRLSPISMAVGEPQDAPPSLLAGVDRLACASLESLPAGQSVRPNFGARR